MLTEEHETTASRGKGDLTCGIANVILPRPVSINRVDSEKHLA